MHFSINKPIDHLRSKEAYNNIKAMASTYEPLIPSTTTTTKNTFFSCKSISLTLSIAATLISLIATFITYHQSPSTNLSNPTHVPFQLCTQSPNPASCHAIVSDAIATVQSQQTEPNPTRILHTLIQQSLDQLDNTLVHVTSINHKVNYDMSSQLQSALTDCIQLLDISRDHLLYSATALAAGAYTDARTWLSAVLTNHVTCLDGSDNHPEIKGQLDSLMSLASAALSVLNDVSSSESDDDDDDVTESIVKFPSWVTVKDRMLLEASAASGIQANVTVAKDGSGNYSTLQDAVNSAPNKTKTRYVIYVRNGTYAENVNVGKTKTNVMIVGDGMNSTVITGSLNVVDNSTTFNSATLAAVGEGFILQDICIENTAGPQKHQAVALRVGADKSVINRCQLNGYQDTLYTHSLRQFYRDSNISGTVDFIFGNAAVVFQNCNLIARLPMSNQQNLVTAQGRIDPNQNTGTSIQSCQVIPSPDLLPMEASIPTYLGRPWKNFSRTVYMQSYIDSHINPKGWLEWDGDFALDTLYYGEFANTGPGAGLAGRVNWTGYHVITDPKVAMNFTVGAFIQGTEWLQSTGVAFSEGLV